MRSAVVFFENQKINFERYPKFISESISFADFFYFYSVGNENLSNNIFKRIYRYNGNINQIYRDLLQYDNIVVIVMSYRPIDLIFITHLKSKFKDLKTISVQHGMYSDKLERSSLFSFFINTFKRLVSYVSTILWIDIFTLKQRLLILKEIFFVYVLNKHKLSESLLSEILYLPENAFVLGEQWKSYYKHYFYNNKLPIFYNVLSKDMNLLNNSEYVEGKSVVIIAQSLVEDGRYSYQKLVSEFEIIINCIPKDFKIYIKRHPRSNNKMYEQLSKSIVLTDEFIVADYIISGYSSLMQIYHSIGCNVFSWKFAEHHNPEYFNNYADLFGRENELILFFNLDNEKITFKRNNDVGLEYALLIKKIMNE